MDLHRLMAEPVVRALEQRVVARALGSAFTFSPEPALTFSQKTALWLADTGWFAEVDDCLRPVAFNRNNMVISAWGHMYVMWVGDSVYIHARNEQVFVEGVRKYLTQHGLL